MNTIDAILNEPKRYADLPLLIMMAGFLTGKFASDFRFSADLYFIYPWGSITAMFLALMAFLLAITNIILFIRNYISKKERPQVIYLLLTSFPIICIAVLIVFDN